MHEIKDRRGRVHFTHKGPRTEFCADVVTAKTVHSFRCVCSPDDNHDHETLLAERARLVLRHDAVIDGYTALVGKKGSVDGVGYEITDCKIRILGPANWELYISWLEDHGGPEPIRQTVTFDKDVPDAHIPPAEVLKLIGDHMGPRGGQIRKAHEAIRAHVGPG